MGPEEMDNGTLSACNNSGAKTGIKKGEVQMEVEASERMIGELDAVINILEEVISPILRGACPVDESAKEASVESFLAGELKKQNQSLYQMIVRIRSIVDRVEL